MHRDHGRERSGALRPIDNRFQRDVLFAEFDRLGTAGVCDLAGKQKRQHNDWGKRSWTVRHGRVPVSFVRLYNMNLEMEIGPRSGLVHRSLAPLGPRASRPYPPPTLPRLRGRVGWGRRNGRGPSINTGGNDETR